MTCFRDTTIRYWAAVALGLLSFAAVGGCATFESCCGSGRALCARQPCGPTVCGACYGYCPTCWSAWPACCEMCPPPGQPDLPVSNGRFSGKEHGETSGEVVHIALRDAVKKPVANVPADVASSDDRTAEGDNLISVASAPPASRAVSAEPAVADLRQPRIHLAVNLENVTADTSAVGLVPPMFRSALLY